MRPFDEAGEGEPESVTSIAAKFLGALRRTRPELLCGLEGAVFEHQLELAYDLLTRLREHPPLQRFTFEAGVAKYGDAPVAADDGSGWATVLETSGVRELTLDGVDRFGDLLSLAGDVLHRVYEVYGSSVATEWFFTSDGAGYRVRLATRWDPPASAPDGPARCVLNFYRGSTILSAEMDPGYARRDVSALSRDEILAALARAEKTDYDPWP